MKQAKLNNQFLCPYCHYLEVSKRAKEFTYCPRCGEYVKIRLVDEDKITWGEEVAANGDNE